MSTLPLRPNLDRRFFVGAAIGTALIVFAGFAPSYYLKAWFGTPELPLLVHVHGLVMTAWIALFLTQTVLIAKGRVDLHRKLGVLGAALAVLIVLVGLFTVYAAAVREVHADPNSRDAQFSLLLLGFNPVNLLVFASLVAGAIALRRRGDMHKRLMLLATLSLLGPPIARFQFLHSATEILLLVDLCLIVCAVADTWRHRRLHPVFGWGVPLIIAVFHLTYLGVHTRAWLQFARSLVT